METITEEKSYAAIWKSGEVPQEIMRNYLNRYGDLNSDNFYSPESISRHNKIPYTDEQYERLHAALPSKEVLKKIRSSNLLFLPTPPIPMSLKDLWEYKYKDEERVYQGRVAPLGGMDYRDSITKEKYFGEELLSITDNDDITEEPLPELAWMALKKIPIVADKILPAGCSRSWEIEWDKQKTLLKPGELLPTTSQILWAIKMSCRMTITSYRSPEDVLFRRFRSTRPTVPTDFAVTSTLVNGKRVVLGSVGVDHVGDFTFIARLVDKNFSGIKVAEYCMHAGLCPVQIFPA